MSLGVDRPATSVSNLEPLLAKQGKAPEPLFRSVPGGRDRNTTSLKGRSVTTDVRVQTFYRYQLLPQPKAVPAVPFSGELTLPLSWAVDFVKYRTELGRP